jgi:hypothetical protein
VYLVPFVEDELTVFQANSFAEMRERVWLYTTLVFAVDGTILSSTVGRGPKAC